MKSMGFIVEGDVEREWISTIFVNRIVIWNQLVLSCINTVVYVRIY